MAGLQESVRGYTVPQPQPDAGVYPFDVPLQPGPGGTGQPTLIGQTTGYDPNGMAYTYAPNPETNTNLYSTVPSVGGINTAVSGQGSITKPAYEGQQQSQLDATLKGGLMDKSAKLQAEAEARRLGYLSTVQGQQGTVTRTGPAADENAARTAAFARAKEQAGQTALASLKALHDVMDSRGMTGSSQESGAEASVLGGARGDINNFTRDQLMLDLNRAADVSDSDYQGRLTQRGQNLSMVPSLMGLITAGGGSLY